MPQTHYETLEVSRSASIETIRSAYRALTEKYAGDQLSPGVPQKRAALSEAYATLSDSTRRAEYDAALMRADAQRADASVPRNPAGIYVPTAAEMEVPAASGPAEFAAHAFRTGMWSGFWRRVAARFVDGLVLYVGFIIMAAFAAAITAMLKNPMAGFIVIYGGYFIIWLAYHSAMNASEGLGTLGRRAAGIAVVSAENGERITLLRSFCRALVSFFSAILILPDLIQLFTPRRRSLSDLITGTVVVRRNNKGLHGCLIAVLVVFFGLSVLGIAAAIAIPAYQNYAKRGKWASVQFHDGSSAPQLMLRVAVAGDGPSPGGAC